MKLSKKLVGKTDISREMTFNEIVLKIGQLSYLQNLYTLCTYKNNSNPIKTNCILFLDIEVANRHGHTCLMIACYKGHYKIAKFLIDIKADVNRKSVKGNTALHDCAESGSLEIMKLLLCNNAKMDVDAYGMREPCFDVI